MESSENPEAIALKPASVARTLEIGERTLWRWIACGIFPPPDIRLGAKVRRWKRETLEAWIAAQADGGTR